MKSVTGFELLGFGGGIGGCGGAARTGEFGCGGTCSFAVLRGVPGCNWSGSVYPVAGGREFVEGRNLAS